MPCTRFKRLMAAPACKIEQLGMHAIEFLSFQARSPLCFQKTANSHHFARLHAAHAWLRTGLWVYSKTEGRRLARVVGSGVVSSHAQLPQSAGGVNRATGEQHGKEK